MLKSAVSRS